MRIVSTTHQIPHTHIALLLKERIREMDTMPTSIMGGARRIYYIAKHLNPSLRSGYLTLRDRDPVESIFERNSLSEMSVDNC